MRASAFHSSRLIGLLSRRVNGSTGSVLPATSSNCNALSAPLSCSVSTAANLDSSRGVAGVSAAGGAFVLSRRLPPSLPGAEGQQRGLASSQPVQISDCDESPFGQAPDEDDDLLAVAVGGAAQSRAPAMQTGGVLFGAGLASRTARKPKAMPQQARWIGSSMHSGDWTRASTKRPVAEPTVWSQILGACKEDKSGETLKSTVAMLAAASQTSNVAPPLPAFNKLLELCSLSPETMETVHQLVGIMDAAKLEPNSETQKQLEACFAYNNRERAN